MLPIVIIVLALALDQISKLVIAGWLPSLGSVPIIPGIISFTYAENTGVAFSFFSNSPVFLTIVITAVLAIAVVFLIKNYHEGNLFRIAMALIIGGAAGNLLDRIFRGFVVDFFEFKFMRFAIFNVADIFICVGAGLLILFFLLSLKKEMAEKKNAAK